MQWLKNAWVTLGVIASAIALALLGRKATKLSAQVKAKEDMASELLNKGTSKELKKSKELIESASRDKDVGVAVRNKMQEHLDNIGSNDETLDDIAHRFNSRRLRNDSHQSHS